MDLVDLIVLLPWDLHIEIRANFNKHFILGIVTYFLDLQTLIRTITTTITTNMVPAKTSTTTTTTGITQVAKTGPGLTIKCNRL